MTLSSSIDVVPLSDADRATMSALRRELTGFWSMPVFQASLRVGYDAYIALTPPVAGVAVETSNDPLVPGWVCRPTDAVEGEVLLYLHGGAYVMGSAAAYRGLVSQIAARARRVAYILEYPLAPEAPSPTAIHLAVAAVERLAQTHRKIAVVGESAGGGLTLATLARTSKATAAVVFSPWTDMTFSGASLRERATRDFLLGEGALRDAARGYLGGSSSNDAHGSPWMNVPDTLPPLLIQVGSEEILYDDSLLYARKAREKGREVVLQEYTGMHHVFQQNVVQLEAARHALDFAAEFLDQHMR